MKPTPKADGLRQMREANFAASQKAARAPKSTKPLPPHPPAPKPSPAPARRRQ